MGDKTNNRKNFLCPHGLFFEQVSMKKVKILKHVGSYVPDQIIEVDDDLAENLCSVGIFDDGITQVEFRRAIYVDQIIDPKEIDLSNLTVDEARNLGRRNIVDSKEGEAIAEKKVRRPKG